MKTYRVTIEKTLRGSFEVSAETSAEAIGLAEEKFAEGEFSVEQGEVSDRKIRTEASDGTERTGWKKF